MAIRPWYSGEPMKIDEALHGLNHRSTVDQRLAVLRQFLEYWHGRLRTDDGYTAEELRGILLPKPLRWWYRHAGHRESFISGQNFLRAPSELQPEADGRAVFYVENQGVYLWSTRLEGDDPPVWGRYQRNDVPWSEEGMTLSEFLIGACLFQAIMDAPFGAGSACAEPSTLDRIARIVRPLPLVRWRWPADPTRFFASDGAFLCSSPNDDSEGNKAFSIWIGSTTAKPLAFLKEIVDDTWEYVELIRS